ncbi:MAG: 5-formyltetrahydrofolate cyclo-ligase [Sphaerochaeta sp.]
MKKAELRTVMKTRIQEMGDDDWRAEDQESVLALASSPWFNDREWIFGFVPINGEVDITPLLEAALQTKRLALPRSNGDDTLTFYEVTDLHTLIQGRFGIREPLGSTEVFPDEHALIIVPALAYSTTRQRLGRGRGYYDRYLGRYSDVLSIGVCRSYQLVEELPTGKYDRTVDHLLCNGVWY